MSCFYFDREKYELVYDKSNKRPSPYESLDSFEKEVEEAFGITDVPSRVKSKIHSKAWSDGHAYGYNEVLNHYHDLVGILEAVYGEE